MKKPKCIRCGYQRWLYQYGDSALCSACWDVVATDAAIADGQKRVTRPKIRTTEPYPVPLSGPLAEIARD